MARLHTLGACALDFSDLEFLDNHIDFQTPSSRKWERSPSKSRSLTATRGSEGSQFDVAEVSFKDCHFDQGFDFVGSSFRGDGMPNFEHCIFHTLMKHMVVMLLAALDVLRSQTYGYCLL